MSDRIYIQDIRRFGLCSKGLRRFAAMHGLDWSDFLANGIERSRLENIDDVYLKEILRSVKW